MNLQQALGAFLQRSKKANRGQLRLSEFPQVFLDLDRVLDFESMSEDKMVRLMNCVVDIQNQNSNPSSKIRDKYFGVIRRASRALAELRSIHFKWGFITPELNRALSDIEFELNEISKAEKTWRKGRPLKLNEVQTIAIENLHDILDRSRKNTSKSWRGFNVKQVGQFSRQTPRADQMFRATPARLISNIAADLGVDLSELTVEYVVKKSRHSKRKKN